jgi:hypothetical protein
MSNLLLSNVSESIIELGNVIDQYMEEQKDSTTPPDFDDEEALLKYLSEKSGLTFCIDDMKKQQYESDIEARIYQLTSYFQTIKNYEIVFAGIRNYYFNLKMAEMGEQLPDVPENVEEPEVQSPEVFKQTHMPATDTSNPDAYGPT